MRKHVFEIAIGLLTLANIFWLAHEIKADASSFWLVPVLSMWVLGGLWWSDA